MPKQATIVGFEDLSSCAPIHPRGWSRRELGEIERIRAACGMHSWLELALGESDEGDPWCIVHTRECEHTILHIARIDGSYVIAWPCKSILQKTSSIVAALDLVLRALDREIHAGSTGHAA